MKLTGLLAEEAKAGEHLSAILRRSAPSGTDRERIEALVEQLATLSTDNAPAELVVTCHSGVKLLSRWTRLIAGGYCADHIAYGDDRFRTLVDGSLQGVFVHVAGRIVYANEAIAKLHGFRVDELIGTSVTDLVMPDELPRLMVVQAKARVADFEFRARRRDGSGIWVNASARNIVWDGMRARQITVADISERKRAERALRESERRYRSIIDTANEGFCQIDENGRIVEVNDALARMLGYSRDQLLGKTPFDLCDAENESLLRERWRLAKGDGHQRNYYMILKSNIGRDVHVSVSQTNSAGHDGGPGGTFAFITDLTEHKDREQQLRQAQKMQAVGQLTGGIAHDFNNLLAIISGHTELLAEISDHDGAARRSIAAVRRAAQRGAELTHRLLAFSRQQPLLTKLTDANVLIRGMLDLLAGSLGQAIEIETALASDLWKVVVDPGQLENVFLNLTINARDAMPDGGKLTIETRNLEVDRKMAVHLDLEPGSYVSFSMTDTGVGISAEVLEHVFEPFFTTKEVGQGSGLGLSMVYGFARQSNGHVKISSEVGIGTNIKLFLPKSAEKVCMPETVNVAEQRAPGHGELILVVEDHPDVRELTVRLLESLGYLTAEADSGEAAIDVLRAKPDVALVFTDVVLPGGMNGVKLAREVGTHFDGVKVLLTTGHMQDTLTSETTTEIGAPIIEKPFRKAELARKVRTTLSRDH
ncbi:MAG: PAS domain S-box protein [Sphingomonadales bacterium]